MIIQIKQNYAGLRKGEYPSSGDQLDAVFKLAKALKDAGIELPADTLAWIDQCQAVKDKYPKPNDRSEQS